jgi:predicted nuclease with TOPRIM domain
MKSEALEVMKERDFYHAKVDELKLYIRKLEYDNAELVTERKKLTERVKFLATNPPRRPNTRYRNRAQ